MFGFRCVDELSTCIYNQTRKTKVLRCHFGVFVGTCSAQCKQNYKKIMKVLIKEYFSNFRKFDFSSASIIRLVYLAAFMRRFI